MRAVIVEDETAAVSNLKAILIDLMPEIQILKVLDSVRGCVEWFSNNDAPDLVFMDIQLADGQSFMIFNQIDIESPVIFTTAYDEYALEAFKVNSIDYLLKPLHPEDVERALTKFRKLTTKDKADYTERISNLLSNGSYLKTLLVPHRDKLIPLSMDTISFFYSKNEKVIIATTDGKIYPLSKTLDSIMNKLDPTVFYRANRQFIISHDSVKEVVIWFGNRLAVTMDVETEERVIISKARVADFKRWLTDN